MFRSHKGAPYSESEEGLAGFTRGLIQSQSNVIQPKSAALLEQLKKDAGDYSGMLSHLFILFNTTTGNFSPDLRADLSRA